MDYIASKTLDDRRLRMMVKARRLFSKVNLPAGWKELGPLGGLAMNIYGAVSKLPILGLDLPTSKLCSFENISTSWQAQRKNL